jgi:glycosyltransferase involved in cell wall biosynthesis
VISELPIVTDAGESLRAHVLDLDLCDQIRAIPRTEPSSGRWADRARLLVRLFGEPLGVQWVPLPPDGLGVAAIRQALISEWTNAILDRGGVISRTDDLDGPIVGDATPFSAAHERFLANGCPPCNVIVCTRDRHVELTRCLESLTAQDHPRFTVWVTDNAPTTSGTRDAVKAFSSLLDVRYVLEPRPGLSRARNAALRQPLDGDFVAWIDDDEVADRMWLSELARALEDRPDASSVSGLVTPAELATVAQVWFEQFGGHSKGRGFTSAEFSPKTRQMQSHLYPLPPFGVGANMAFRLAVLREMGGFDEALGAGTLTRGGEDTKMFTDILRAGGTSLYRPSAVTRHFHRRDVQGLSDQMYGYGSGLTAFYTSLVLADPRTVWPLARLVGTAVHDVVSPSSLRVATLESDFPRALLRRNQRGMLAGPSLYLRQRLLDRRRRRHR